MSPTVAGVVLAAGAGSRFGHESKLLAQLDGRPLLQYTVDAVAVVHELDPVVVVLGAQAERVRAAVDFGRVQTVVCADWADGLSASLRCGVAALGGVPRVLVALGDVVGLNAAVIRRLLGSPPGSRAGYGGAPGHPVLLGPDQLLRLDQLHGDVGARELLGNAPLVECGDLASGVDVDTPADLSDPSIRPLG